jgi:hypothetical protein
MRILLATAVAIAPLMAASGAMAEVVISTTRTTPITTGNATGTGADSVRIDSTGVIEVSGGTAVTVNSSNNFSITGGGSIRMPTSANGSTAILVNPGVTSTININGRVTVDDTITNYADTDNDGDIDGPWATGSDRYGVRMEAGAPVIGNLIVGTSGTISVDGNNSFGISIESGLTGNVKSQGVINVAGNNSTAFSATGDVSGNIDLLGTVNANGENASAVNITGDVGGRVNLQGQISATGYRYTARGSATAEAGLEAEDKLQSGAGVTIAGNVGGGVIVGRPPTTSTTNTDVDGDGILDAEEGTGSITVFGGAPALQIGSASQSITLGAVGTGDDAYGFINRGVIEANGLYDNVASTGLLIGGNAGQSVTLTGGINNNGNVLSSATEANSTAVRLGTGVTAPVFLNSGIISGGVRSDSASQATGFLIETGASVPTLNNSGVILATGLGGDVNVTALQDVSGTLSSITNTGTIRAELDQSDDTTPTGRAVAVDLRNNTSGVTLVQNGTPSTPTATDPDTDGDGVTDSREPAISGDILLGSGNDSLDVRNGVVVGAIDFGNGNDALSITGGSIVQGALSTSSGNLSINVANGTLDARHQGRLDVSSLTVGSDGLLVVSLDPQNASSQGFDVSGTANFATGAELGLRFDSLIQGPGRFDLVTAGTLNAGSLNLDSLSDNSPYLYVVEGGVDAAAGTIFADVRQRTAAEAGLISSEASIYDAVYGALGRDDDIRDAFLAQLDREGFVNLYEQLLPEHSGGPLLSLASGVDAVTRALTGRNASAAPGETSAWVQEINFYADKDRTDTYGFRSEGFGVAGGVERGTGLGAVGLSVAFTSSDLEDPEAEAEEVLSANLLELGLYWRAQGQYWTTWARAAAGYASFESERRLVGAGLNLRNEASWNGVTLAAAGGASYERNFGRFSIRPEVYAEYFSLSEDGYTEEGGGDGFDLQIDDREGHLLSATAAVNIGMGMGENSWLRPELRLGWRQNISVDPGDTIGRFAAGGPDFRLDPATVEGGGPILGLRMNVGNELGMLSISADAELIEDYVRYMLFLRASFRF